MPELHTHKYFSKLTRDGQTIARIDALTTGDWRITLYGAGGYRRETSRAVAVNWLTALVTAEAIAG